MFKLEEHDLSLEVLIFMSILELYWTDRVNKKLMVVLGNNIFANSLIGVTIQDSGKRERSNEQSWFWFKNFNFIF